DTKLMRHTQGGVAYVADAERIAAREPALRGRNAYVTLLRSKRGLPHANVDVREGVIEQIEPRRSTVGGKTARPSRPGHARLTTRTEPIGEVAVSRISARNGRRSGSRRKMQRGGEGSGCRERGGRS